MDFPLRLLLIEDSEDDALRVVHELKRYGHTLIYERVNTGAALDEAIERDRWDLIISDYSMAGFSGLAALALVQKKEIDIPFIVISDAIGEEIAVQVMKAGAHDYLIKGNLTRLIPAIERELREAKVRQERKQAHEFIDYMAYHDPLTALPNRALLQEHLQQAIKLSRREHNTVALLLMDLDRFKEINNTLGHHSGDIVLQQIGLRLKSLLRDSDTVARLGGDEFAVLLPLADAAHWEIVARKIIRVMETPLVINDLPIAVEISIGIALSPEHGDSADLLIQYADVAMYVAKRQKSGFVLYEPALDQHSPRRLALMGELRQAIDQHHLRLYYQPKIDLKTGRMTGVEGLLRWPHAQHGFIPPDQFIAPAEQTGLIFPLTRYVLEEAIRQGCAWRQAGLHSCIAINLSTRNLQDPTLPQQVAELMAIHGIEPSSLELELTESAIMMNPPRAMEVLTQLHEMGVALTIDDFGIGYSSLAYLNKLPIGTIKIDKSFVLGMLTNENDRVIVRSTIDLGHNLGLKVVAEGVENQATWTTLAGFGCDLAQGYHISRPMPAAELPAWISQSPWGAGVSTAS